MGGTPLLAVKKRLGGGKVVGDYDLVTWQVQVDRRGPLSMRFSKDSDFLALAISSS
jgi:hypothetical protein